MLTGVLIVVAVACALAGVVMLALDRRAAPASVPSSTSWPLPGSPVAVMGPPGPTEADRRQLRDRMTEAAYLLRDHLPANLRQVISEQILPAVADSVRGET